MSSSLMPEQIGDASSPDGAAEVKIKKTRASKPKVKTGCQTCKFVNLDFFVFKSFVHPSRTVLHLQHLRSQPCFRPEFSNLTYSRFVFQLSFIGFSP